jgi:hypothetical protein
MAGLGRKSLGKNLSHTLVAELQFWGSESAVEFPQYVVNLSSVAIGVSSLK